MIRFLLVGLFVFLASETWVSAQVQNESFSHLQPRHRELLKKWLTNEPGLRPAVDDDAEQESLEAWRRDNKDFFPYYVVADFNGDRKEDFAILLKVTKSDDKGVLVIFNAPFTHSKPAYINRKFGVRDYYLDYHTETKALYFTAYETHGFYLKPKGKTYIEWDPHDEEESPEK